MGRMETESKVCVLKVYQHTVVTWLDSFRNELRVIHFEGGLPLKKVQLAIIRAQSKLPVHLRYGKYRGLEVAKRETLCAS